MKFEDVFRVDLQADPVADVESFRITLRPDAKPFRARTHRYGSTQSTFVRKHVRQVKKMGFIRRNNMSLWACATVPVQKVARPTEFLLTLVFVRMREQF
ncbi:hypothetical protein F441_00033 [Phytophthora nicotianae CJ01A1]|uniref:Uncharacterized protein n=2 Tax=Phytophthora nicotianae TaxID=4792 RepID=W2HQ64_PHYNI|nr:hypothetical protein L915_00034 [Phytophthora nicotianae]ETL50767.1 hypothetical protein L916_00032 [Phytophthora nicotianae]ETM03802.1 hypothetical protein L917_00022 [Phytophthora nicotianae]ETP27463.1 hypothetical protein F441_00033 [Phytophthora nicotianae CJ01A1]